MNTQAWILSTLLAAIILFVNSPTQAMFQTDDKPTISSYECVDEDGDEACDAPPED
jgi:hypothetical protein